jgi:branched-chain amino acid transport system permease protein
VFLFECCNDIFIITRYDLINYLIHFTLCVVEIISKRIFLIILLSVSFVNMLLKSPRGLLLTAIRDNEIRAEYMGASAQKTIHLFYVISGVLAGLGGAIAAVAVGHIDPTMSFWTTSGEMIFITILGGTGSVIAPFIGALVFGIIHTIAFSYSPNTWQMVIGLSLIFVILMLPNGLWSLREKFWKRKL